jgi:V-type H+-transporting ATPase subunit a
MTFAICLQVPNHFHFKKMLNLYAEFIPQILFFHSIFGYLVVCIIYKWSIDWSQTDSQPPGLLNMLIYMFLSPGTVDESSRLFKGQAFVQVVLLLIALVSVPWMLCLKPYVLYKEHQAIKGQGYQGLTSQDNGRPSTQIDEDEEEGVGQAVAQEMDEEHVSLESTTGKGVHADVRNSSLEISLSTKSFTRSSSVLDVSPTRKSASMSMY